MKSPWEARMLVQMLDALDLAVYTFDKNRKILHANAYARKALDGQLAGGTAPAVQQDHVVTNSYFDEKGTPVDFPNASIVEKALKGIATRNLILEHRNANARSQRWLNISCEPVMDDSGEFVYAIVWFRNVSRTKLREDKLQFLLRASKVLSISMDFERRLQEKARLLVPTLADWCSVDILQPDKTIKRVAIVHSDQKKVEWMRKSPERFVVDQTAGIPRVLSSGKAEFVPLITNNMVIDSPQLTERQRKNIEDMGISSYMIIPILAGGKPMGTLTVSYAESGRIYTHDDFDFMRQFAENLSILLENSRLYQEIVRKDRAKDMFLASLSHELRNPLAAIKSSLELLHFKNPDSHSVELRVIEQQFDHMTSILNDLLEVSRFTEGKIRLDFEPLDIISLVDDVLRASETIIHNAGLTLKVSFCHGPVAVFADRTRISQAVANLLNNAIKFTKKGGEIVVSVVQEDSSVLISVKDTGAGITPSELEHIFETNYQSERVRGKNIGMGIGLSLSSEIVRLHSGRIIAKSAGPDQGSEFTIALPLLTHRQKKRASADISQPIERTTIKKIAVVDDNESAANALVELLRALGWQADAFYSGKDVLEHLSHTTPDTVFLDIDMPGMDGYEVVRALRERGHTTLPIIALTGFGLKEDKRKALAAGFTDHYTKPIGVKELRDILI